MIEGPMFRRASPQEAEAMMQRMADEAAARREAAVAKYGSESAALAPCPRERALRDAGLLLLVRGGDGRSPSLSGWAGGTTSALPMEVRREISTAVRMPSSLVATWAEYLHWRERAEVLAAFDPEADQPLWVRARRVLLEERLDNTPARDREDVLARLSWMQEVLDLGYSRPIAQDEACLAALRRDIEAGAVPLPKPAPGKDEPEAAAIVTTGRFPAIEPPATVPDDNPEAAAPAPVLPDLGAAPAADQLGHRHRSREEARGAVRTLLGEGLTDREIARRVGVSPSTVASVRRASCAGE